MGTTSKTHKARKTGGKPRGASKGGTAEIQSGVTPPADTAVATIPEPPPSTLEGKPEEPQSIPQEAPPKKQLWYRPPDSKVRKSFEKIAIMRAAGHDDKTIAKRLKTTEQTVRQTVYIAKKNGWADDDGEPVDVEAELAFNIDRKIVRNLSAALDGQMTNWQTHEVTLAGAKGRGMFKSHEKTEVTGQQNGMVAIQIIMPAIGAADQLPHIGDDQIGGTPNYLEGEVEQQALPGAQG